jgi:hypothetical protein
MHMTRDQIDSILERVHYWHRQRQEDAARLLLAIEAQDTATYVLSDEERADLMAALEEVERDEIAEESEALAAVSPYRATGGGRVSSDSGTARREHPPR